MNFNPLLAIVGMAGAGKSTAVFHLATRGWPVVYFGQITLDEIERRDLEPKPDIEQQVRESLRRTHGEDAYAKFSLSKILHHLQHKPTVVDGLYSWAEYKFLRTHVPNPMYVIAICVQRFLRYERLLKRPTRPLKPEDAEKRDIAEIENIQKGGPIAIADFTLLNDGTEDELRHCVDTIVERVIKRC